MRSPKILLGQIFPARPRALFDWPTVAFWALLMLTLLAWPMTGRAQSPAGAGAGSQKQSPASDQQQQPNPTAQQGSPAPVVPQVSPQNAADAPQQQQAIRPQQPLTPEAVLDRIISQEQAEVGLVRQYSPLVETYVQYLRPDKTTGAAPDGDRYFLGRAELSRGVDLMPLDKDASLKHRAIGSWSEFFTSQFLPSGFLQMIFIDMNGFDRQHYRMEYVRREFLGEVRCLVFDVDPLSTKDKKDKGRFVGRIWVEDQDFHIVRFNGAYGGSSLVSNYYNFDSWRTNVGKNLWLPSFIYSEEGSLRDKRSLNIGFKVFRAQTRLWGYDLGHARQQQELSKVLVEGSGVRDQEETASDYSPLQSQRSWSHQAEDNVTDRLERMGLMAPYGEVDRILETVVNNLEVTNNLDVQPDVRCRVLMTSTLESFTIGHTIVISRGLLDVLPDEASLAMVIAHELSHIVLGHHFDTKLAFNDKLFFPDEESFQRLDFKRTPADEEAADTKALDLLKNSPYKDKLGNAGLFLKALQQHSPDLPKLISPHLGNSLAGGKSLRMSTLLASAPALDQKKLDQIAALPLGGRIKVDPWSDQVELSKAKQVALVSSREKMEFEITPFFPYLTRLTTGGAEKMATVATPAPETSPK